MDEDDSIVPSPEWWDAMSTLTAHGLATVRVTKTSSGQATVVWRNPPSDSEKAAAEALIGAATHSW